MRSILKTTSLIICRLISTFTKSYDPRIAVLMYHSVSSSAWKHAVSPEVFEKQIVYLKKQFKIVTLDYINDIVSGKIEACDRAVAITFDDGYRDTFTDAYNILKKHGVKATVFLTTNFGERKKFANLERPNQNDIKNTEDVFSIESHGHNHLYFNLLNKEEIEYDITECDRCIRELNNKTARFFAYPYGASSTTSREILKNRFELLFGINEGFVRQGDDKCNIRRIQVDNTMSALQFKLRLTGALDINRKVVDFFRKRYGKK